jgi:hypothetical protein
VRERPYSLAARGMFTDMVMRGSAIWTVANHREAGPQIAFLKVEPRAARLQSNPLPGTDVDVNVSGARHHRWHHRTRPEAVPHKLTITRPRAGSILTDQGSTRSQPASHGCIVRIKRDNKRKKCRRLLTNRHSDVTTVWPWSSVRCNFLEK